MAIRWDWKDKCGEATLKQTINGETGTFTLSLYTGNCYLIMLHEFTNDAGKQVYTMWGFWANFKHMRDCLGLNKGTDNIYNTGYQYFANFRLDRKKCRYWKQIKAALKEAFPDVAVEVY